jgi:hypothetical protein
MAKVEKVGKAKICPPNVIILEKAVEALASWSSVPKFKVFLAVFK